MKLLGVLLILAILVGIILAVGYIIGHIQSYRKDWEVGERTLPGRLYGVFCIGPGNKWELFGEPISQKLPEHEFEELLLERRIGAEARCNTLNRRLNA